MELVETATPTKNMRAELLQFLGGFSQHLADEVLIGKELTDLDLSNSFTDMIDGAIKNPFTSTISTIVEMEKYVLGVTDAHVRNFLKSKKTLINQAYKTYSGSTLHYCIVLKKDSNAIRGKFYDYLDNYGKNAYLSRRFPITFKFIPAEYVEHLLEQAELIF
jgi:hypothetical protein